MSNWPWESEKDHLKICADLVEIPLVARQQTSIINHSIMSDGRHGLGCRQPLSCLSEHGGMSTETKLICLSMICSPTIEHIWINLTHKAPPKGIPQAGCLPYLAVSVCSSATQSNSKSTLKVAAPVKASSHGPPDWEQGWSLYSLELSEDSQGPHVKMSH